MNGAIATEGARILRTAFGILSGRGEPSTALILFMTYGAHVASLRAQSWPAHVYARLAREAAAGGGLIGFLRVEPELGTPVRGGLGITCRTPLFRDYADAPPDRRYVQAVLTRPPGRVEELHDTPVGLLAGMVEEVVRIEGPVHVDEVVDRVRDAWGLRRSGGRIQQAVEAAIGMCARTGRIERTRNFLALPGAGIRIRDRSEAASGTRYTEAGMQTVDR